MLPWAWETLARLFLELSIGLPSLGRLEATHQSLLTLWHQLHIDMKTLLSWQYLQRYLQQIQSWSLLMVRLYSSPPLGWGGAAILAPP